MTAGGCHCFYSFTTPPKKVNTTSNHIESCKHFPYRLIFQNIYAHFAEHVMCPPWAMTAQLAGGTLLYISCCVNVPFSLSCFMVMRFTEVSNAALGIFHLRVQVRRHQGFDSCRCSRVMSDMTVRFENIAAKHFLHANRMSFKDPNAT